MSHMSMKDIDRQNEERMLWNRIWESFRILQRDIDNFNENTENRKKEHESEVEGDPVQEHLRYKEAEDADTDTA